MIAIFVLASWAAHGQGAETYIFRDHFGGWNERVFAPVLVRPHERASRIASTTPVNSAELARISRAMRARGRPQHSRADVVADEALAGETTVIVVDHVTGIASILSHALHGHFYSQDSFIVIYCSELPPDDEEDFVSGVRRERMIVRRTSPGGGRTFGLWLVFFFFFSSCCVVWTGARGTLQAFI